jgi:hypothetical protein
MQDFEQMGEFILQLVVKCHDDPTLHVRTKILRHTRTEAEKLDSTAHTSHTKMQIPGSFV